MVVDRIHDERVFSTNFCTDFSAVCFLFLKPITIKESTMSMFPIMIIAGAFMLISVVVGIYGVRFFIVEIRKKP